MATMIPSEPLVGAPLSERRVFEALRALGDEWTVLHSVNWQSKRGGRQGDGEADFVLISNCAGVLVLEVKGGSIRIKQGRWFTVDHTGTEHVIKDPFRQATHSKHALLAYLSGNGIRTSDISLMHAVAFPDIAIPSSLGPAAPVSITWDSIALADVCKTIRITIHHWGGSSSLSIKETQQMISLIAPTVSIRRRLADDVADVHTKLIRLTDEQIWIFSQLRTVRCALVTGAAGTGKTILAIERARRLAADGFRTLLVCYNELLSRSLQAQFGNDLPARITTFHHLCASEAAKALLYIPKERSDEWWDTIAPGLLVEAAARNELSFDAIVVDEGQDFSEDWIASLQLLNSGSSDAPMYVFADQHQRLYRRYWKSPADWTQLELSLNCRNTIPIAERVATLFGERTQVRGTSGPPPQFYVMDVQNEGTRFVQDFIARLVDEEGMRADQICVLSNNTPFVLRLHQLFAGSSSFVKFGQRGVVTETIARYKGLESEVVLVVVTDELLRDPHASELLYTGMSRAKAALFVAGSAAVRNLARWNDVAT